MWWQTILIDILSVTSILSIIAVVRFWKQNKKLKDNEVKINDSEVTQSNVEAQKAEIDLANKYRDEMLNMVQMVKDANEKNFTNQDDIIRRLERLDKRIDKLETNYGYMQEYLNGNYHLFLAEKQKAAEGQSRYNPNIKPDEDSSKS